MALIFSPLARLNNGVLKVIVGTGVVNQTAVFCGLKIDSEGRVFSVLDGVINHYHQGLPFDSFGRLVVSQNPIEYSDMGVPFTSSGAVAIGTS